MAKDCTQAGNDNQRPRRNFGDRDNRDNREKKCFKCQGSGHFARECEAQ